MLFKDACIDLQLRTALRTKSANAVYFVSNLIAVIRVKPARQTNMSPRSLGTNSPVTLIVIYALLIWPSIEGRKYNCICMLSVFYELQVNCYYTDAQVIRNAIECFGIVRSLLYICSAVVNKKRADICLIIFVVLS